MYESIQVKSKLNLLVISNRSYILWMRFIKIFHILFAEVVRGFSSISNARA